MMAVGADGVGVGRCRDPACYKYLFIKLKNDLSGVYVYVLRYRPSLFLMSCFSILIYFYSILIRVVCVF